MWSQSDRLLKGRWHDGGS